MELEERIGRVRRWAAERLRPGSAIHVKDFWASPEETARLAAETPGELARLFFATRGRMIHKWPHYLPVYERYFAGSRGTGVRMLEIGVSDGGSLDLWRRYFGPEAMIFGVDIDPTCAAVVSPPNQVRIGSQADPAFLREVVAEMGGVDIVLDDGSHVARHQRIAFETLFPALSDGGLYVIEDLQTAYWADYDGGYRRAGTAIALVKRLIDDLHAWYHGKPTATPAKDQVGAIHVHDAIVVIESAAAPRLARSGWAREAHLRPRGYCELSPAWRILPPPCGEGLGVGVSTATFELGRRGASRSTASLPPTPDPSPQGGGEERRLAVPI